MSKTHDAHQQQSTQSTGRSEKGSPSTIRERVCAMRSFSQNCTMIARKHSDSAKHSTIQSKAPRRKIVHNHRVDNKATTTDSPVTGACLYDPLAVGATWLRVPHPCKRGLAAGPQPQGKPPKGQSLQRTVHPFEAPRSNCKPAKDQGPRAPPPELPCPSFCSGSMQFNSILAGGHTATAWVN